MLEFEKINSRPDQQELLKVVATHRKYESNDLLNFMEAVHIKDDKVFMELFRNTQFQQNVGFLGKTVIPGPTPFGDVHTLIGYDAVAQLQSKIEQEKFTDYFYPPMFSKNSFIYAPRKAWQSILESKYIIVVEGPFDSAALNFHGFNAVSLLGSELSKDTKRILSSYRHIFCMVDNDSAGFKLAKNMKQQFPWSKRLGLPIQMGTDPDDYFLRNLPHALESLSHLLTI